jgi:hypothetical protein
MAARRGLWQNRFRATNAMASTVAIRIAVDGSGTGAAAAVMLQSPEPFVAKFPATTPNTSRELNGPSQLPKWARYDCRNKSRGRPDAEILENGADPQASRLEDLRIFQVLPAASQPLDLAGINPAKTLRFKDRWLNRGPGVTRTLRHGGRRDDAPQPSSPSELGLNWGAEGYTFSPAPLHENITEAVGRCGWHDPTRHQLVAVFSHLRHNAAERAFVLSWKSGVRLWGPWFDVDDVAISDGEGDVLDFGRRGVLHGFNCISRFCLAKVFKDR